MCEGTLGRAGQQPLYASGSWEKDRSLHPNFLESRWKGVGTVKGVDVCVHRWAPTCSSYIKGGRQ